MTWREHARPIIARVLAQTQGQDDKTIRQALHDAYPYGERAMHPYQAWCDEIRAQRGTKPRKRVRPNAEAILGTDATPSLFDVTEEERTHEQVPCR